MAACEPEEPVMESELFDAQSGTESGIVSGDPCGSESGCLSEPSSPNMAPIAAAIASAPGSRSPVNRNQDLDAETLVMGETGADNDVANVLELESSEEEVSEESSESEFEA